MCTADPTLEPPMLVISTVLSVMAYDYPPEKLNIYLSDDTGSAITLYALYEASEFAKHWVPFCKKYMVEPRSPAAYFAKADGPPDACNPKEWFALKVGVKISYALCCNLAHLNLIFISLGPGTLTFCHGGPPYMFFENVKPANSCLLSFFFSHLYVLQEIHKDLTNRVSSVVNSGKIPEAAECKVGGFTQWNAGTTCTDHPSIVQVTF